ncbi:hypothetical protein PRZ48_008235 [Zasmidium cellare]|uniref:Enoyl reductase (ER) domain-containing protein n=1 Tax=Zasmidium cellare TaxID=395010 RepID=A0ABR0EEW4_ZASCE|nr:hypothetical protein PRZ48_008235 [Zasmidium cellare]
MPAVDPFSVLPKQQTTIVVAGPGKLEIKHDAPMPEMTPSTVIVKTAALAINPADAKMLDYSAVPGAIHGYDYAGTIVALGSEVAAEGRLSVGDRVAGLVHGMNKLKPEIGAFAEYVSGCADLMLKLPDGMSFEEGASLGTGVATAALGLFKELKVTPSLEPLADGKVSAQEESEFVLVSGGSTATGTRAIQLLKLAGLRPIATSSPRNFDLCYHFGAEKVFDYKSPDCASEIRRYTQGELAFALDCVSQADTTQLCFSAIGRAGGKYCALEPFRESVAKTRELTLRPSWLMVLTIFGGPVALDGEYGREASAEDREFGRQAFKAVQGLMDRGLIEAHPVKNLKGGWKGVVEGVERIRSQAMSGQKLVCSVA